MANKEACPNCRTVLPPRAEYCPSCGQSQKVLRKALRPIIWDFVESTLNLNGRLWHTLAVMFRRPGQFSLDYVAGKRARYLSPVRLLLFLSALYLGSYLSKRTSRVDFGLYGGPEHVKALLVIDSVQSCLAEEVVRLASGEGGLCPEVADSLKKSIARVFGPYKQLADSLKADTLHFKIKEGKPISIPMKDVIIYSEKEILEKYEIHGWWKKWLLRQMLRVLHGMDEFIKDFFQSKSWWLVMLMVPLLSLALAIVFWRKKKFYVEHLILSLEINCYLSVIGLPLNVMPDIIAGIYMLVLPVWTFLYLSRVLSRYYGLSPSSSFAFSLLISILFLPAFFISMFIVVAFSFLLF